MKLNGTRYFYIRNVQNDIVGLTDPSGTVVVRYEYNAWGKLLSITGSLAATIGAKNPFRYRGYYYDTETDIEPLLVQAYYNAVTNHQVVGGWLRANEEMIKFSKQTVAERFADLLSTDKTLKENSPPADEFVSDDVSKPIVLLEAFDIQYSAQAYAGGNLTDVTRPMTLTWQEILIALMKIPATFSSYGLQNAVNRLIASKAEQDIKKEMPNVHAVSRCQISQDDLNQLQRQLVGANWIQLTTYGTRVSQELWKLTFHAKNLLNEVHHNSQ